MKVLVVRLSSMGDVVQTLPAVEDAVRALPDVSFDWAVEESFADIPKWHPRVENVLPLGIRRWNLSRVDAVRKGEPGRALRLLRSRRYDAVIDLQGTLKSAAIARLARGPRVGYDARSSNEWGAHAAYRRRIKVEKGIHSSLRMRKLLAAALGYEFDAENADHGIDRSRLEPDGVEIGGPFLVFITSTSWPSKNWPEDRWKRLTEIARAAGFQVAIPWGSDAEREQAERIAAGNAFVLPRLTIGQKASVIARAAAAVGLDTGLTHIAAALDVPQVSLYGPTDPKLVGALGPRQVRLVARFDCLFCHQRVCTYPGLADFKPACLVEFTPERVWGELMKLLSSR